MPSKKQYNLVHNDEYDTRIPLHSDEAFHRGIIFHAKLIGSMEVPRPTSRVEIVAAMRRIRYEFKAKGIKKKKVTIEVSVDGLKVTLRKKKKKQNWMDENKMFLMHHPIYRIFYVSHDSHDLKIFSYIARDGSGNTFKCNVFKSSKKSQAMRVVRTVGQAFEVCHKLSMNQVAEERDRSQDKDKDTEAENLQQDDYDNQDDLATVRSQTSPASVHKDLSLLGDSEEPIAEQTSVPCLLRSHNVPMTPVSTMPIRQSPSGAGTTSDGGMVAASELAGLKHEVQLLRERLEQQYQQTRAAVSHARLLQEQLAAETATRVEAQARAHQLFVQNKDLLEHISALVEFRGQERLSDGLATTQQQQTSQVPTSSNVPQTVTTPDLSSLGQFQRTGSQSSPWELEPPAFPYCSYSTEPIHPGNSSIIGMQSGSNDCTEQLHFQTQLLERLHNISPYQTTQRSPYTSPSPYPTTLLYPPSASMHSLSPGSMSSLRVSQTNSFSSSPVMSHKCDNYGPMGLETSDSLDSTFIRPLPCITHQKGGLKTQRNNNYEDPPPTVLDPVPAPRKSIEKKIDNCKEAKRHEEKRSPEKAATSVVVQRTLPSVLRAPGHTPSRTTSARLPPRNDLMGSVRTWARHTTK